VNGSTANKRRPAPAATDAGQGSSAARKQNRNHRQNTASGRGSGNAEPLGPTRSDWAAALIDAATGPIPEYGTPEFEALDNHDPVKVASCVRAAEAWRTYWLPEEQARRLRVELDAARNYEETARRLGLDRRTVKSKVSRSGSDQDNGASPAMG
jgi:hypothetical protein